MWEACFSHYQYFITMMRLVIFALLWNPGGKGKTLK